MGQRGPIPLEKTDKALRGNTPGRRMTEAVRASGRMLPAPDWMTEDEREIWRETVRHAPANLLARIDAGILTTYVVHRHAYEALARVAEGRPRDLSLMADALSKHQAAMLRASAALGLDPASRARLRVDAEVVTPSKSAGNLFDQLKDA
jgi:phage terminase small subunit